MSTNRIKIAIAAAILALLIPAFGCSENTTPISTATSPAVISGKVTYWRVLYERAVKNSGTPELTGVIAAASGTRHDIAIVGLDYGLALKSDGTLWSWNIDIGGSLQPSEPIQETGFRNITAISTCMGNTLALDSAGKVWSWDAFGNVPKGTTTKTPLTPTTPTPAPTGDSLPPVQVSGLGKVTAISAGLRYSLALQTDGRVWAWGSRSDSNKWGQLGNGTTTNNSVPAQVSNLSGVIAIAAGSYHALALKSDGTVWAWGDNESGELGNGTTDSSYVPVQVSGLKDVVAIAAGEAHSLALKKDGTVWSWGNNESGQAGNGTQNSKDSPAVTTPIKVSNLSNIVAVSEGGLPGGGPELNGGMIKYGTGYCLALKSDGTVWTWGSYEWNSYEPWAEAHNSTPVQVSELSGVKAIAGGGQYAVVLVP